ncbi:MAG: beta-galactosidase [Planctomycetota bacterium]
MNTAVSRPVFFLALLCLWAIPAAAIEVRVETGDPLHWVLPGQLDRVELRVKHEGEPLVVSIDVAVEDHRVEPSVYDIKQTLELPGDRAVSIAISAEVIGPRVGVKYVFYRVTASGEETQSDADQIVSGLTQFAVVDPVGVTPGVQKGEFIFANHGPRGDPKVDPDHQERVIRALSIAGAEVMRLGMSWLNLEPRPGAFDWSSMDHVYDLMDQYGIAPQLLMAYGGRDWTKDEATLAEMRADGITFEHWPAPTYSPRPDLWGQWCAEVARRYGDRTELYEIWNEPDIEHFFRGTPEQYVDLLKSGSEAIRAVDDDAVVMTGGFVGPDHPVADPRFLTATMEQARSSFDWFAYHRHGTFSMLRLDIEHLLTPLIDASLDEMPPLYFSETSMGREPDREYEMAIELPKRVAYLWSIGAKGWTGFTTHQKYSSTSGFLYAMFNPDFTPRPVWVGYNEMARQMRGRRFVRTLDLGEGRFGYAFRGKGDFRGTDDRSWLWVAWTEDTATAEQAVPIRVGADARVERVDLMGNRTPIETREGIAVMPVSREPAYFVAEGVEGEPALLPVFLEAEGLGLTLVAGGPSAGLPLKIRNPLTEPLTVSLTATQGSAENETGSPTEPRERGLPLVEPSSVTVPAGGERTVILRAALPAGVVTAEPIRVSAVSGVLDGTVVVPIAAARLSPGGSFEEMARRSPDYVLNRSDQVVNNQDIDPGSAHLTWQGPEDVSVKAWVGLEDESLLLRFDVRDDVHRQPYVGRALWQGDAVQVGLGLPGRAGHLEFGVSLTDTGEPDKHVWVVPPGGSAGEILEQISFEAEPDGSDTTTYRVRVPLSAFGASRDALGRGVLLSFVAQDLDEATPDTIREGFIELSEGITGVKNPRLFPLILFAEQ